MLGWCCRQSATPHPRDGAWAWLVCFSAAVGNFLHFGFTQCFGVFLPVLTEYFGENRATTAWAGSIAIAFTFFFGPLAVRLSQRFGPRVVTLCAGLLCVISLVSSSFATSIVFMYFSYGMLFGIGASCILTNGFLVVAKYFSFSKRSFAMGIAASGGSIGILSLGPSMQLLIDTVGWRNALRVMAGIMTLSLLGATYDPNVEQDSTVPQIPPVTSKKWWQTFLDCSVWKSKEYTVGTIAILLTYFAFYIPSLHIVKFAKDLNISSTKASHLFIYIGIFSTVARVIIGKVLDKSWMKPIQGVQLSALVMGVSIIALASATKYSHFIVFSVFYGIVNGVFITAQAIFFQTSVEPHKSAMGLGMGYMTMSVAVVSGAPTVGFIADQFGSYIPSFYVIGGLLLVAAAIPFSLCCVECTTDTLLHRRESVHVSIKERLASVGSAKSDVFNDSTDLENGQTVELLVTSSRETVL